MSIAPLPEDVAAQIKSSSNITSLNNTVCGLVRNSLDAAATKINISLDYARGNCTLEDDGLGIPPAEFTTDGGLGNPHCMLQLALSFYWFYLCCVWNLTPSAP